MDGLTQKVVNKLLDWGADLVGVAPVERFEDAPEGHNPTDFMPECKSVISIALHIFQGMADVWGEPDVPEKTITPYLFYGYGLTNIESSRIVNRMARALEYSGYKTLAFMPTWISSMTKYFDDTLVTNEITAEFSHRHAAVAAGIAELGWNGLTLTPEFGSMQRLNTLLTSAEMEPTLSMTARRCVCRRSAGSDAFISVRPRQFRRSKPSPASSAAGRSPMRLTTTFAAPTACTE